MVCAGWAPGRSGGQQVINLDGVGACDQALVTHEIGHAVGLYPTQHNNGDASDASIEWDDIKSTNKTGASSESIQVDLAIIDEMYSTCSDAPPVGA